MAHPLGVQARYWAREVGQHSVRGMGELLSAIDALDAYHAAESRAESPEDEQKVRADLLGLASELGELEDPEGQAHCEVAESHIGVLRRLLADARERVKEVEQAFSEYRWVGALETEGAGRECPWYFGGGCGIDGDHGCWWNNFPETRKVGSDVGCELQRQEFRIGHMAEALTDAREQAEKAEQETIKVRRGFRCSNEQCTGCREDPVFPERVGVEEVDELLDRWQMSADESGEIEGVGFARIWTWCAQALSKSPLVEAFRNALAAIPEGCEVAECSDCNEGRVLVPSEQYPGGDGDPLPGEWPCGLCDGTGKRLRKKEA